MERFLCVDAFAAEPGVQPVKMRFAPVIISPGDGLGGSAGSDHKRETLPASFVLDPRRPVRGLTEPPLAPIGFAK
jgi:hypothetical protein